MTEKSADIQVVADAIYTMLEEVIEQDVELEIITTDPDEMPQLMMHSMPRENPVIRAYKNGDYIGAYDWDIYLRVATTDADKRIDAIQALTDAGKVIREATPEMQMPANFSRPKTSGGLFPKLQDATDAYETYKVTFTTEYKHEKER